MNSDYKVLTAVIARLIKQRSLQIPAEQLATEGVWDTVHGLLQDKAAWLAAKRSAHYSAWVDFKKSYDSISHRQLRRLIRTLPIHYSVVNVLLDVTKKWSVRVAVGKCTSKPIYIKRGVYQGDTISPLMFVLVTAFIAHEVKASPEVNAAARGRQEILAYMDDIKLHAATKKGLAAAIGCVRECANEVGLEMNNKKCGVYTTCAEEMEEGEEGGAAVEREDAAFLPRIRDGYKYLGIIQLDLDTEINIDLIKEKTLAKVRDILSSKLAASQKIYLISSTAVSAATYVLGNSFSAKKRTTIMRICKELDTVIRRLLVELKMKTYTTSTASVYLDRDRGGLGLRAIADEVELHHVRKGRYLELHPDLETARQRFLKLGKGGYKNPITDLGQILEGHGLEREPGGDGTAVSDRVRKLVIKVREK